MSKRERNKRVFPQRTKEQRHISLSVCPENVSFVRHCAAAAVAFKADVEWMEVYLCVAVCSVIDALLRREGNSFLRQFSADFSSNFVLLIILFQFS